MIQRRHLAWRPIFCVWVQSYIIAKESAGKKSGYAGKKIGNAYLKWAFSEAAVLFLKGNPPAQKAIARLASKHGKGKALSILAHRLGRAVYVMLSKRQPFDEERFMATL